MALISRFISETLRLIYASFGFRGAVTHFIAESPPAFRPQYHLRAYTVAPAILTPSLHNGISAPPDE